MWVETPGSAGREQRGRATATGAGPRRCSCTRQPVPSSSRARDCCGVGQLLGATPQRQVQLPCVGRSCLSPWGQTHEQHPSSVSLYFHFSSTPRQRDPCSSGSGSLRGRWVLLPPSPHAVLTSSGFIPTPSPAHFCSSRSCCFQLLSCIPAPSPR